MSIAASEFGGARTVLAPEPASLTAIATIAREQDGAPGGDQGPATLGRRASRSQLAVGVAGRRVESRVLGEDRSLELLKLAAGLEPKLLDQPAARVAIALERVGLAPGSVQREHQLSR